MGRRNLILLLAISAIWGASFLFIKVAVRDLAPATLILGRLGLAALTLALIAPFTVGTRETLAQLRANAKWLTLVALVNTAIPFWLLSWGETRIQSGLASILQAAVPIFNALLAFAFFRELRVRGLQLLGVAVGFVGVALLVGAQPQGKVLGALAVVGMALGYGIGGLLISRHLRHVEPLVVALASTAISALLAAPAGIAQGIGASIGWKAAASVVVLGVVGTGIAYLIWFALIRNAGPAYAALCTYLIPPIALAYGAIFLSEHFGVSAFLAMLVILAGVALGSGRVPIPSRVWAGGTRSSSSRSARSGGRRTSSSRSASASSRPPR
jgi:drug/metabolite transporter (DMT)-like permease